MKIEEIVKMEREREGAFNVVHFVKDGGFYHANDWSAWLMRKFPFAEAANKPDGMAVTAKRLKDGYVHAFVGFPQASLLKYIPNDGSVVFQPVSDTQIDVTLNVDFGTATYDDIRKEVDAWKASLPVADGKKQRREEQEASAAIGRFTRFSDVFARILAYPVESKSPMEAWEFVRQLRMQAAAMF